MRSSPAGSSVGPRIRRIASVCTGIYGLAPTGLLDGRRVATHWRFARTWRALPGAAGRADAIFVADGPFVTSAESRRHDSPGAHRGRSWCRACDERSARAGGYLKRDGGQAQFSEPLRFQSAPAIALANSSAGSAPT